MLDHKSVDTATLGNWSDNKMPPDNACINYERCENTVPTGAQICDACLDKARDADSNG